MKSIRRLVVSFYLDYLKIFRPSIGVYIIKIDYYDFIFAILIDRSKQFSPISLVMFDVFLSLGPS